VRFNEDIKEYIKAALSPAEIAEIKLDKENLKAEVIVADDQLSLSIGKHGQNVRLASRLIGWELDIRTKTTSAESKAKEIKEQKPVVEESASEAEEIALSIKNLSGVGEKTFGVLKEAGYNTVGDVASASVEDLLKIKGIGEKKAEKLIAEAKKLMKK
jgi:N utilization substance protein A